MSKYSIWSDVLSRGFPSGYVLLVNIRRNWKVRNHREIDNNWQEQENYKYLLLIYYKITDCSILQLGVIIIPITQIQMKFFFSSNQAEYN